MYVSAFDIRLIMSGWPTISTYTFQLPEGTTVERSNDVVATARFDAAEYKFPAESA
jgi:hypothetical protein